MQELPEDPQQLRAMCKDLSRRLQSALCTVEARRRQVQRAQGDSERAKLRFVQAHRQLSLEIAKNAELTRRKIQADETVRFERTKLDAEQLHEQFRLAAIDHQLSGAPREPMRISRLRARIEDAESKLDSQKSVVSVNLDAFYYFLV